MIISYYFRNKRVSKEYLISQFNVSFVEEITADAKAQFSSLLSVKVGSSCNYLYPTPYGFVTVNVLRR